MSRRVQWLLLGSALVAALAALAGCSHYLSGEREAWRGEAEAACLSSGAVSESAERVRVSAIEGPGICGADYPLRVSALGESAPLGYDDEPVRPPGAIPDAALPPRWPVAQQKALPPAAAPIQPRYNPAQYGPPPPGFVRNAPPQNYPLPASQQAGAPMSLYPPGVSLPEVSLPDVSPPSEDDWAFQPAPPRPYVIAPAPRVTGPTAAGYPPQSYPPPNYPPQGYPSQGYPSQGYPPSDYPQRADSSRLEWMSTYRSVHPERRW